MRAALVLVVLTGWATRHAAADPVSGDAVQAPHTATHIDGVPALHLDPAARARAGIDVARLAPATFRDLRQGYATVLDATPLADVVRRIAEARAGALSAKARLSAADQTRQRSRVLYGKQANVSLAQLQATEANASSAQASGTAADAALRALTLTARLRWGPVLGAALIDATPLAERLLDRRDLLLQVTLAPGDGPATPPGTADVRIPGRAAVAAHFVSPAARVDPAIQAPSYFYVVPASSGLLSGLHLAVSLPFGPSRTGALVPTDAIVWAHGQAWAYREQGADDFVPTPIAMAHPAPDGGAIVTSLPPGTRLVVRGAQLLLSEAARAQLQGSDD